MTIERHVPDSTCIDSTGGEPNLQVPPTNTDQCILKRTTVNQEQQMHADADAARAVAAALAAAEERAAAVLAAQRAAEDVRIDLLECTEKYKALQQRIQEVFDDMAAKTAIMRQQKAEATATATKLRNDLLTQRTAAAAEQIQTAWKPDLPAVRATVLQQPTAQLVLAGSTDLAAFGDGSSSQVEVGKNPYDLDSGEEPAAAVRTRSPRRNGAAAVETGPAAGTGSVSDSGEVPKELPVPAPVAGAEAEAEAAAAAATAAAAVEEEEKHSSKPDEPALVRKRKREREGLTAGDAARGGKPKIDQPGDSKPTIGQPGDSTALASYTITKSNVLNKGCVKYLEFVLWYIGNCGGPDGAFDVKRTKAQIKEDMMNFNVWSHRDQCRYYSALTSKNKSYAFSTEPVFKNIGSEGEEHVLNKAWYEGRNTPRHGDKTGVIDRYVAKWPVRLDRWPPADSEQ
ncbi:hypothetical protein JKP88DRAFT_267093 [Tribonema minus]|uniref:Uncharacterized protein n=1 Tax=Tribonema minus TaxID=303371 RepID=A0A835ZCR3_9STRA|nr:hypothetical protein JKP88DRAFT_267093 [Tribonema minus]